MGFYYVVSSGTPILGFALWDHGGSWDAGTTVWA